MNASSVALEDALATVRTIDLTMVSLKLADPEEGAGWDAETIDRVQEEYLRYLALSQVYSDQAIVPSKIVDTFWHYHILDTQAYAADCDRVFGTFLHHYPYFGMRGPEDAQALGDAYDSTIEVYDRHFGPAPADIWARTGAARCPNCGRQCRKQI
jgi:hypothetical protein